MGPPVALHVMQHPCPSRAPSAWRLLPVARPQRAKVFCPSRAPSVQRFSACRTRAPLPCFPSFPAPTSSSLSYFACSSLGKGGGRGRVLGGRRSGGGGWLHLQCSAALRWSTDCSDDLPVELPLLVDGPPVALTSQLQLLGSLVDSNTTAVPCSSTKPVKQLSHCGWSAATPVHPTKSSALPKRGRGQHSTPVNTHNPPGERASNPSLGSIGDHQWTSDTPPHWDAQSAYTGIRTRDLHSDTMSESQPLTSGIKWLSEGLGFESQCVHFGHPSARGVRGPLWLTRDAPARLAIHNHLPLAKCAHFGQHRTSQALYDAVVARYSSPATTALGRLLLPYLFPELSAFATVEDLVSHLRTSDARYRAAAPAEDHFLSLDPTVLTIDLLEQHLLVAETSVIAVGAARGTPRTPFFEGCSPFPLPPSYASAAAVDVLVLRTSGLLLLVQSTVAARARVAGVVAVAAGVVVGAAMEVVEAVEVVAAVGVVAGVGALVAAVEAAVGVAVVAVVGAVAVGQELSVEVQEEAKGSSSSVGARPRCPSSLVSGFLSVGRLGVEVAARMSIARAECPRWEELLRTGVAIFDLDYDAILAAMYALSVSAEGDCYLCVPPDPGIEAAALGASESVLLGTAPAEALHTFTIDSGASRYFFRDSTTLTPLSAPVPVRLADPSGGPVLARSSTVLSRSVVPSSSLSGLHLPSFSTNLVSTATVAPPCSCHLMSHQTLLWHHRLGHPSLPLLRGMHSRLLSVSSSASGSVRTFLSCVCTLTKMVSSPLTSYGDFCRGEGILQSFTLLDSPQQNGIAERRIGLVMELNLWPRVSLPETSPTLRWTGKVGDASVFRVWGSRAFVHDTSADKLSACTISCVFLGFSPDAPGWQFYHPTSRRVFPSQDVTFDESVPFYCLFPYRSAPPPPPPLFLAPGPPPVDPLPGTAPVEVAIDSGAARGAAFGGAASGGAEPRGAESEGTGSGGAEPGGEEPWGAEPAGVEPGGAEPKGVEPGGAESEGAVSGAGGAGVTAGAGGSGGAAAVGPGGARTRCARAAGNDGFGGAGAGHPTEPGAAGARGAGAIGARAGGTGAGGAGAGGAGAIDPGAGGAVSGGTRAGGTVLPQPYYVPLLQEVLGVPSSFGLTPPLLCPPPDQSQPLLLPASALPAPSPCTEQTGRLTERCEPASRPASPVRTSRRVPLPRPPLVPGTHAMALRPSSVPLRVSLPAPPESSLPAVPDPQSDVARAVSPTASRLLVTIVTDPSFESTAASALVAEPFDFAAACRLDYATALVAKSESSNPPSVGGECALGTDVLEDRQEDFEFLAATVPRFASMLLAPEGDPDAPDIPTPRSYAEAITGPYSSQWQAAMDAEIASWKSTGTYVDAVPPSRANLVNGMWIFRVKRPPGSPPAFKARYVARGFSFTLVYPSLFLHTDMSLPPFYVIVYVDDLVFATSDTYALTLVKSELQKRHTCTDLGELRSYLGFKITRDRARRTITLT
ncbi:unnamed protein product [Closterium sp. NIES-54]